MVQSQRSAGYSTFFFYSTRYGFIFHSTLILALNKFMLSYRKILVHILECLNVQVFTTSTLASLIWRNFFE